MAEQEGDSDSLLSRKPNEAQILGLRDHNLSRRLTVNLLSHPGTPLKSFLISLEIWSHILFHQYSTQLDYQIELLFSLPPYFSVDFRKTLCAISPSNGRPALISTREVLADHPNQNFSPLMAFPQFLHIVIIHVHNLLALFCGKFWTHLGYWNYGANGVIV